MRFQQGLPDRPRGVVWSFVVSFEEVIDRISPDIEEDLPCQRESIGMQTA